ncbi:MAG: Ig-like domain-containing protein [Pseudomonadota bacterium]
MNEFAGIRAAFARVVLAAAVIVGGLFGATSAVAAGDPAQGPGGPILVVTTAGTNYGKFYAEILRTEGLNSFTVADIGSVTPSQLAAYDVVILARMPLAASQASMFGTWVNGGGNLIAMAPDASLDGLLGIASTGTTLSNAYLLVDTGKSPGNGIVGQTLQYHGAANLYTVGTAQRLATLYSTATAVTGSPALTLNAVGSGKAAAFAFDLAESVVTTRQGNPAWATQERDGFAPIRSDDKFFGAAASDPQPDWIDLTKVAIPQADEQQRLLANLILQMNASRKPLPRFWYFPNGKKAVVVMTGDDHANGGTAGRFDQFAAASPAGCSVANWECVRGTSYIYTGTPLSNAQASQYAANGFEIGLHVNTNCGNFDRPSLESFYSGQLADWRAKYAGLTGPATMRHHCIAWSDATTGAEVQFNNGIRLDTSYYFWPPGWVNNVPGLFTGSAMPMRFVRPDGTLVDVFQVVSQMTDESGQAYPFTVDTLLDRAVGAEGYYGVYTVNAHTDTVSSPEADATVASAQARGVPIVSARQMLTWLDGRNASSFGNFAWNGATLGFTVTRDPAAVGLQGMLPMRSGNALLSGITRAGTPVGFTPSVVKGVEYAMFPAEPGSYSATYGTDATAPLSTLVSPSAGATGVSVSAKPAVTFSEAMDASTIGPATFELRDASGAMVAATITYDATTRTATLAPSVPLATSTTYTALLRGGTADPRVKDAAGNALATDLSWSFTTSTITFPNCPCGGFAPTATPATASVNDPNAVELGVRFTADVNGTVTGIRFFKGSTNTGTHIGNLWTSTGTLLATATFVNETATGWQQVNFTTPVAITANTVYVASYFAPAGNYAADGAFFASTGVDKPPIHLLQNGTGGGGNGLYTYGASSAFPASSFNATNYWVDVAFTPAGPAPPDTTPPTVVANAPSNGATGVALGTNVSVTFDESIDPATLNTNTFTLTTGAGAPVAGAVSYNAATRSATFVPAAPLAASTTFTVSLKGGATDPRVKDAAGNALAADAAWSFTTGVAGGTCAAPSNPVVAENCLAGSPPSEWDVSGAGDPTLQGFATQISVNRGSTVSFKVNTTAAAYRFDIYRMGYYGGMGARKVATVNPTAALPQSQPACLTEAATGLVDCGNWAVSGAWAIPADAASGIYFARLVRPDTGGASHVVFVVRDDASNSDVLFQTSDTTWQAYNEYGGNSLYTGLPAGRAYKVSYNRPFTTRAVANGQDWLFNAEYPMVRWLEANGYNVTYFTGVDADRFGSLILNHKAFLSVGHDEYWSGTQRANVEAARASGVNLAFFSGNEVFWKTRWENSIDGTGTAHRTLVSYKETLANAKIDPTAAWTGTWRDPRFSPPADGGRPENALAGTIFMNNDTGTPYSITVPAADGKMRLWRNTSVAALGSGQTATLPIGTLGYEWDSDLDNGFRPAGLFRMSTTAITSNGMLLDFGSSYGQGTVTHSLTLYKHPSGARVFGAGTVQWSWGLDANHDRGNTAADPRMQQATVNLFADMGVQPGTLQSGLVGATASTDVAAPVSTITSPASGATVTGGNSLTITGTAADTGGGVVGGVEVSTDGGATWHRANGREAWSYAWTPVAASTPVIKSRSVDDSGNLETPSAGVPVTVGTQVCPCTIFSPLAAPANASEADTGAVNVGVKFTADVAGVISGIRFYKGSGNTGTHIGTLWTSGGAQLATATFTDETASGWQQVNFTTPVAITANTVYVASYLAPVGRYAGDNNGFSTAAVDNPPLHALRDGTNGGNGVYAYGATTTFPNATFQGTNYWVDVVFSPSGGPDTTPPTVAGVTPAPGATAVSRSTTVTATFNEPMDATTMVAANFELRDAANALVATGFAYNATTRVATLTPSATLAAATVYTATVKTGVKDAAGNAMAADRVWSFTTVAGDTTAPTVTTVTPSGGATGVSRTTTVTATFSEAMDAATITSSNLQLRNAANTLVAATVAYDATTRIATLTPSSALAGSTTFTMTVGTGVRDVAGNPMAAARVWSFTTVSADTTAPTVTAVNPQGGATGVSRTTTVTATFSEAMDAATITSSNLQLRNAANTLVAATVAYDATTRIATLTPSSALAGSTTFTMTVGTGVRDVAGNPMAAARVWSFTTVSADTTAPTVTAVSPQGGATGVSRGVNVTATFSEAMNATTINGTTVQLRNSFNTLIAATVTYNATSRVVTLNPNSSLSPLTTYTVTIRGGTTDPRVKDVAGNAMNANRTWSFTTRLF